jgi:ParB-like chromosome segregation protein Spo0J
MKIQKVKLADYQPAPYNPRDDLKPGEPEYEAIAASLNQFTLVSPIVVNKQTGNIVGGNQRASILKDQGHERARAVVIDVDLTAEKAINLALNKISGDWDYDKLEAVIRELEIKAPNLLKASGFTDLQLDALLGRLNDQFGFEEREEGTGRQPADPDEGHTVILSFDSEGTLQQFLEHVGVKRDTAPAIILDGEALECLA